MSMELNELAGPLIFCMIAEHDLNVPALKDIDLVDHLHRKATGQLIHLPKLLKILDPRACGGAAVQNGVQLRLLRFYSLFRLLAVLLKASAPACG